MKRDDRQFKKNDKKLKHQYFILLCVSTFSLLLLMMSVSKAADPSADYPSRPIEYVTHSAPGSQTDVYCRQICDGGR
jgi:hypothetical protein